MTLHITVDANIPLAEALFSKLGTVTRLEGRTLKNSDLQHTDILLVRSVTSVNSELLENTPVKFVGTATIGTDHIDEDYLQQQNIGFASAQGCNANSVAEYILSALVVSSRLESLIEGKQRLAIVGAGNVGSRLAFFASVLGIEFGCYDPPLRNASAKHHDWNWIDWQEVLAADVISLHVPLTDSGDYPTKYMFAAKQFSQLKKGSLLINSARGAVVDNDALLAALESQQSPHLEAILDVWEAEPEINLRLYDACLFGSPHIAGYSKDGKEKGSQMLYQSLLKFLELPLPSDKMMVAATETTEWLTAEGFYKNLSRCILKSYDLCVDSAKLGMVDKTMVDETMVRQKFDQLRKNYPERLEFEHYSILNVPQQYTEQMQQLGFYVKSK